jgi:hypothetical protein
MQVQSSWIRFANGLLKSQVSDPPGHASFCTPSLGNNKVFLGDVPEWIIVMGRVPTDFRKMVEFAWSRPAAPEVRKIQYLSEPLGPLHVSGRKLASGDTEQFKFLSQTTGMGKLHETVTQI